MPLRWRAAAGRGPPSRKAGVIVSRAGPLFCFYSQIKYHFICEYQSITLIILPLQRQPDEVSDLIDIVFGMTIDAGPIIPEKIFHE